MKSLFRALPAVLFWLLFMPIFVFGQDTEALCRLFVNRAFREIGANCANMNEAEACYAYGNHGEVASTFYIDKVPRIILEDVFDNPSDKVVILDDQQRETLESMKNEKFVLDQNEDNIEEDQWGVSFQLVRGNLPRQLEQDEAVYILFGGARIENGIYPEDALVLPENPLALTARDATIVYGSPLGQGYQVPDDEVGTVSGSIEADGISEDGAWVRIFYPYQREFGQRATAWVQVADLEAALDLDTLPTIGPETYTAMQRLFLSNIFEDPLCPNVPPPGVMIQGPGSTEFDFWINNLPSRVTSTAYFEQVAPRRMRITTLTGFTVLWPDSGSEVVIPAGFHRIVCLTPLLDLGIDGLQNDRELDDDCTGRLLGGTTALSRADLGELQGFTLIPDSVLNYSLSIIPEEICPSGIGDPQCTLQVPTRNLIQIQNSCASGIISNGVCQEYNFANYTENTDIADTLINIVDDTSNLVTEVEFANEGQGGDGVITGDNPTTDSTGSKPDDNKGVDKTPD